MLNSQEKWPAEFNTLNLMKQVTEEDPTEPFAIGAGEQRRGRRAILQREETLLAWRALPQRATRNTA